MQDGVKLAQALQETGGAAAAPTNIAEALREFERERTARAIPVTVKSHMMGAMLQIKNPLVRRLLHMSLSCFPLQQLVDVCTGYLSLLG